ncbi:response regulator [Flavobacterium collinsii]|uniref:Response regulator UvrY n=1 Tax=Flavobacterium collinsii TaxID=1114861 RepID=A0ABM8KLC7_9FLAO|nr:response regulator transcription factor [Flavobacterium collinsii]GIQ61028.1 DNA-binding response regulator [Flavobacterium collinsii]CAA9200435.1 Response regulator UvrY [Flavobacterium collinsii]
MTSSNISFLIADDHSVVRQGVSLLIKELFLNAIIYQSGTLKDTSKVLKDTKIDLLILDINFPDGNSLSIITEAKKMQPGIKILMFTVSDENIYAMKYLNVGAAGFLNKGSTEEEMKQALKNIILSGEYISQNIKDRILDSYILKKAINPLEQLSCREIEITKLLVKGYNTLEISELLHIKKTTVSTFKSRIFEKLEIDKLSTLIELFQFYFE